MRHTCNDCPNLATHHVTNTALFFCDIHMEAFRKSETLHGYQHHRLIDGEDLVHDFSGRRR
ncbi:MAG TPA: hypothetical protein VNJ51_13065 [Candidatus Dormibacteraeota bacterium]|nr:hypothetical protein [Candidatus Dormibacteraeota bacterium]